MLWGAVGHSALWGSPIRRYGAQHAMGQPHTSLWGRARYGAVPHIAMGHSMGQPHMSLWSTARYGAAPHIAMGQPHTSRLRCRPLADPTKTKQSCEPPPHRPHLGGGSPPPPPTALWGSLWGGLQPHISIWDRKGGVGLNGVPIGVQLWGGSTPSYPYGGL